MKKFEYWIYYLGEAAIEEKVLEELGLDGWELVSVVDRPGYNKRLYFKRALGEIPTIHE